MNATSNANVISRFLDEVWNKGNSAAIDVLYAPHGTASGLGEDYKQGPEVFKQLHDLIYSTCRDFNVQVKHMITEGDLVSFYGTFDCTHKASGKKLHMEGGGFAKVEGGQIVEALNAWGFMDLLVQLGAIPGDAFSKALLETV